MQKPGPVEARPIHLVRGEATRRRIAPVVEDADRARCRTVLEKVEAHAGPGATEHPRAINTMGQHLAHRPVAPGVVRRQRGDQGGSQPDPGAGRRHVGLGPADLDIQGGRLLETLRRRGGEAEHDLAQRHQVVTHHGAVTRPRRGEP